MNVRFLSALLLVFILLFFSSPAWSAGDADQPDYKVYTLGEILVSEEKPAVKEIAITNEVTAEDIKATNSRTVAEALSYVPGIQVTTGRKAEPNISIHGFGQGQTLILVDGVPYYETNYGKLNLDQIPADIIAKIEVTKGAPSVLYGPNAEAGVINIVTKKPSEKPSASASFEVGEKSYNRESVSHGMKTGIFNYWLNYTHSETDAWKMANSFDPRLGTTTKKPGGKSQAILEDGSFRDNSDSESNSFWAKLGIEPNPDSEYYVNFHLIKTEKGMPSSISENSVFPNRPAFSQFGRIDKYNDWGIDLNGRQKVIDQLILKTNFFYHNHEDDYVSYNNQTYSTPLGISTYKDYLAGGNLLADYKPVEWNVLRAAVHFKVDSHRERDETYLPFAESLSHTGSIALENEFNLIENLSIVAGLSYDSFRVVKAKYNDTDGSGNLINQNDAASSNTKDAYNPMIGAVYTFADSTKLFGSVAKKTRFPTLSQLYSTKSGNPDLGAEQSINYTVGASHTFFDICRAELSFFHHDISDWISRDGPVCYGNTYQNWAEIKMYGFEFSSDIYPMEDLILKLGYTYNYARDKSHGHVTDNVTDVPEHKIDAQIQYTIPSLKTKLNLNGMYMAKTYSQLPTPSKPALEEREGDDYWLFGARITQPVMKYLEAYIAVNNMFDNDYEPDDGFPARGREIFCGITAKY